VAAAGGALLPEPAGYAGTIKINRNRDYRDRGLTVVTPNEKPDCASGTDRRNEATDHPVLKV
jgi:hypothetical protein